MSVQSLKSYYGKRNSLTRKAPRKESQADWVRAQLEAGRSVTPLDALNHRGIMRLGAIVHNLRREGLDIVTDYPKSGTRYAIYRLAEPNPVSVQGMLL